MMNAINTQHQAGTDILVDLKKLRRGLPQVMETLSLEDQVDIVRWSSMVDKKLLARLSGDFPLVAAICGGGSAGKSTLFNSLIREHVSPTGGTAGINRRMLAAARADQFSAGTQFEQLLAPFDLQFQPLRDKNDLTTPGNPLYVLSDHTPSNLILLDTPDFDTGFKGTYVNRDMARQALELSDILIYIFTNANYNNRDNTDFIARMLTEIGQRKCFLVYRVYTSYGEREIAEHARTVARNLYGESASDYLLGVFRAVEDNRVAADEKFVDLMALNDSGQVSLVSELGKLDTRALRMDLNATVYADMLATANDMLSTAKMSQKSLKSYRDALDNTQRLCVQSALQHFPIKPVMQHFTRIWSESDPSHVKFLRKTGNYIELPLKAAINAAKWFAGKKDPGHDTRDRLRQFSDQFGEDLLTALTTLWRKAVEQQLPVPGSDQDSTVANVVAAHPVVADAQKGLRQRDRIATLSSMLNDKDDIIGISEHIERDLARLADQFRQKTGIIFKVRQTFSAALTVLPATAAITYILSTGDPVGAAGIKVKLTGLFGLKDLYALVAIPATTGLNKADRRQLEALLAPITRTWLDDKLKTIQALFEEKVTGEIFSAADHALDRSGKLIDDLEKALSRL